MAYCVLGGTLVQRAPSLTATTVISTSSTVSPSIVTLSIDLPSAKAAITLPHASGFLGLVVDRAHGLLGLAALVAHVDEPVQLLRRVADQTLPDGRRGFVVSARLLGRARSTDQRHRHEYRE